MNLSATIKANYCFLKNRLLKDELCELLSEEYEIVIEKKRTKLIPREKYLHEGIRILKLLIRYKTRVYSVMDRHN